MKASGNKKKCPTCEETDISRFSKDRTRPDKLRVQCKKCSYESSSRSRKKNPIKRSKETRRDYWLSYKFRINTNTYNFMLEEQKNKCAICEISADDYKEQTGRHLAVDHNHKTRQVRELLCNNCNFLVQAVENNPMLTEMHIHALFEYLEKHERSTNEQSA